MCKYTKEIHEQRLRKMLDKKEPCNCCPAGRGYQPDTFERWGVDVWYGDDGYAVCSICRTFIGLKPRPSGVKRCPCLVLGKKRALMRTYEALGM